MNRRIVACFAVLALSASLQAGPLFDDYLNYVRPGPGTDPGDSQVVAGSRPVGQTFRIGPQVGEVYRIGVRPVYDTWDPGETVTMTLFDAPRGGRTLGEYRIEEATSHAQAIHDTQDRVLYFQFRAPTHGRTEFRFELTAEGGDGRVAFQALSRDAYPDGRLVPATPSIADVAFLCHVKPKADREANLRAFFSERLDVSRPELAAVKRAVEAGDWEKAIAETVRHFHGRMDVWGVWGDVLQAKPQLDVNTELADLLVQGKLQHVETGRPLPWRTESDWVTEYRTDRAQPKHAGKPSLYTWHVDRTLGAAYSQTGRDVYARRLIDLRMQFILDNPSPKTSGLPWYFELWNDRTAAARAPGHGTLPYARLYHYDGWTDDEKLVFFSFLEDNARWDYEATSGANWGAEAARACYEFGLQFPEWKRSADYVRWGTRRLAEIVLRDVRGDGTSTEAAVKYHAMVARRLKGMLEDQAAGRIRLDDDLHRTLLKTVEGMYEHMACTLMPNSFVVMCGDSWYENFAYRVPLSLSDLKDPAGLWHRLKEGKEPVSRHVRSLLPETARTTLDAVGAAAPSRDSHQAMVTALNELIQTDGSTRLYEPAVFANVKLRSSTRILLAQDPVGSDRELLNRLLIEDAFGDDLVKGYHGSELDSAAKLVGRTDFTWIASQGLHGRPPDEASKVFPDAGYFIMRSDFGGSDAAYCDARQLFIHNGLWFGSHGHADLLSVNLYACGRPLLIDPGQYDYEPPPGIDRYWQSRIHSMMVVDDADTKREPGPSEWVSNAIVDYYDGRHFGYRSKGGTVVRRRIAFMKPGYFLVDDSAETTGGRRWTQVWNLTDPDAEVADNGGRIETTFPDGGNLVILNQDPSRFQVETAPGITSSHRGGRGTRIVRLSEQTDRPRFQTLLYPYAGGTKPRINWRLARPDDGGLGGPCWAVEVETDRGHDWAAFGETGHEAAFAGGRHRVNADFAAVRMGPRGEAIEFAWADGRLLVHDGQTLARAEARVHSLAVRGESGRWAIEAPEPESTLAVRAAGATSFVLNGRPVSEPVVKDGMYYPFADAPAAIVADDRDAFERVTETSEWWRVAHPAAWAMGYVQHETDPGRHENGNYHFSVPRAGRYRVQVYLPKATVMPSDRVEYKLVAAGQPAATGGAVVQVCTASRTHVVTVNGQAATGWVTLGEFELKKGQFKVNALNKTGTDGLYFIADAMRLLPIDR